MKQVLRIILIVLTFSSSNGLFAQVQGKFGNTQSALDVNAALEVESTSKGVLLPRLTTAQQNAMSAPTNGMLIYNTDSACFVLRRAGVWRSLCAANGGEAWSTLGNTGTNANTHFLGTTDNIPLSIRVNNQKAGRIDPLLNNAFWGYQAGNSITSGTDNVAMGTTALSTMTTGTHNVAIGGQSGLSNVTGVRNVTLGYSSGRNGTFSNSILIGYQAGLQNAASNNVFMGSLSGSFTNTGADNIALGYLSLFSNITGANNVAIGSSALTTVNGWGNTAVGFRSGMSMQIANANVAVGDSALLNNVLGSNNTMLGYRSGEWATGSNNIAVGYNAQLPVSTASNQLALGNWLYGTGGFLGINTINPQYKLDIDAQTGSTGNPLRLLGLNAGATTDSVLTSASGVVRRLSVAQVLGNAWNITGNASTIDGTNYIGTSDNVPLNFRVFNNKAGRIGNTTDQVVALGYQALNTNTGTGNTAIGYVAGLTNTTGTNNTLIGNAADVSSAALTNATAIGNGATVNASNKIRLGNTSVTNVETYGSFTTISDRRLKNNITDNFIGLNFIKAIRPVQYELKAQKGIVYDGFVAQEIDSIMQKQGIKNFSGLSRPQNAENTEGGYYNVSYSTFVVPLVNAVKELDALSEKLKVKSDKLAIENEALKAELEKMKKDNGVLKASVNKNSQDIEAIKAALTKKQN